MHAAIAGLELLSLDGLTVTADALHCHRRMTKTVRDGRNHQPLCKTGRRPVSERQSKMITILPIAKFVDGIMVHRRRGGALPSSHYREDRTRV